MSKRQAATRDAPSRTRPSLRPHRARCRTRGAVVALDAGRTLAEPTGSAVDVSVVVPHEDDLHWVPIVKVFSMVLDVAQQRMVVASSPTAVVVDVVVVAEAVSATVKRTLVAVLVSVVVVLALVVAPVTEYAIELAPAPALESMTEIVVVFVAVRTLVEVVAAAKAVFVVLSEERNAAAVAQWFVPVVVAVEQN